MSVGDFLESLSQAMLVGKLLIGGLGVFVWLSGKFIKLVPHPVMLGAAML